MTELELYKYITENSIEWHRQDNDGTPDVLIFPYYHQIEDFRKILSVRIFDDDGVACIMKDGYFAFWMSDICSHYGIDMDKVFVEDNK